MKELVSPLTDEKRLLAIGSAWMHPVARISCWDRMMILGASYLWDGSKSGGKEHKAARG